MRTASIECFLVLAEKLNYTEAADQLFITQSALTKIIQQMEEELGVELFVRNKRTVRLTPAGMSFVEDGKQILRQFNAGLNRAREADQGKFGTIRFGCHMNNQEAAVLDIITDFHKHFPDIRLDVLSMHTSAMIRAIDDGSVDCVVSSGLPSKKSIKRIFLKQYRDCAVFSPDHPLANEREIAFSELKNEKFLVMSRDYSSRGYSEVTTLAREAGFSPTLKLSAVSVPHLLTQLAAENAVTILSQNYEYMAHNRLKFVPLKGNHVNEIYFQWDSENPNPCVRTFSEYVQSRYGGFKRHVSHPADVMNF